MKIPGVKIKGVKNLSRFGFRRPEFGKAVKPANPAPLITPVKGPSMKSLLGKK